MARNLGDFLIVMTSPPLTTGSNLYERQAAMSNTLKLVLTDYWFDEIKSGRKTHEYKIIGDEDGE